MSVKVGQTIYVNIRNMFLPSNEPNLEEFVITKVNTKSFYARRKDSLGGYEYKFNKKTMTATSLGDIYTAYLDPNEYWKLVEIEKEKELLRKEIIQEVFNGLDLEKLRQIKAIIEMK